MKPVERRLLKLGDRLAALREEERLVAGELDMHRHLDDDAQRDAAVYGTPVERLNARDTGQDVSRFERRLAQIRSTIERLEAKRQRLLGRLQP